jgi:CubicO group peptidase (beta-lactamase class C family)
MNKLWKIIIILAQMTTLAAHAGEPAQVNNKGLDPALSQKLKTYAESGMKTWRAPGLAIGIVKNGKLVWTGYFGYADIKNKKPITEASVFMPASVSKTFTAVGLMQQWEKGKFKVDDPVNPYGPYPVYKPHIQGCREVNFMDVFTHTSGGGELMSWRQLGRILPTTIVLKGQDRPPLKELYTDGIRPHICPGTKWCYCNFCFGALGLLLEQMSGENFGQYQDAHILKPLGMNSSHFYETDELMKNLAKGYSRSGDKFKELSLTRLPVTPMGGLYSTVPDMSRYIMALLNRGTIDGFTMLKPGTVDYMFTPHFQADPRLEKMGICFFVNENYFGHRVVEHDGANPGYGTQMFIAPDDDLGMVVFTNIMNSSAYQIANGMLKILFNYREPTRDFPEAKDLWPGFVGSYGSPEPDLLTDFRFFMRYLGVFRIRVSNGKLWLDSMRMGKKFQLSQVSKNDPYFFEIMQTNNEIPRFLVFKPGEKGKASSIVIQLDEYVRLEGEAKTKAYTKAIAGAAIPEVF